MMPDIKRLQRVSLAAQRKRELANTKETKRKEDQFSALVEVALPRAIEQSDKEIEAAAKKGYFSACLMSDYSGEYAHALAARLREHYREQGFETQTTTMEPFGSDPLYFHTVYNLVVNWNKK